MKKLILTLLLLNTASALALELSEISYNTEPFVTVFSLSSDIEYPLVRNEATSKFDCENSKIEYYNSKDDHEATFKFDNVAQCEEVKECLLTFTKGEKLTLEVDRVSSEILKVEYSNGYTIDHSTEWGFEGTFGNDQQA
jgi:hypothetical protein